MRYGPSACVRAGSSLRRWISPSPSPGPGLASLMAVYPSGCRTLRRAISLSGRVAAGPAGARGTRATPFAARSPASGLLRFGAEVGIAIPALVRARSPGVAGLLHPALQLGSQPLLRLGVSLALGHVGQLVWVPG